MKQQMKKRLENEITLNKNKKGIKEKKMTETMIKKKQDEHTKNAQENERKYKNRKYENKRN